MNQTNKLRKNLSFPEIFLLDFPPFPEIFLPKLPPFSEIFLLFIRNYSGRSSMRVNVVRVALGLYLI